MSFRRAHCLWCCCCCYHYFYYHDHYHYCFCCCCCCYYYYYYYYYFYFYFYFYYYDYYYHYHYDDDYYYTTLHCAGNREALALTLKVILGLLGHFGGLVMLVMLLFQFFWRGGGSPSWTTRTTKMAKIYRPPPLLAPVADQDYQNDQDYDPPPPDPKIPRLGFRWAPGACIGFRGWSLGL